MCINNFCIFPRHCICSKRRFTENQAETWWSENREMVYKKYNIHGIYGFSASNRAAMRSEGIVLQGTNGSKSGDSVSSHTGDANQTEDAWTEQYEPGVYVTLVALQGGSRDIKRARFRYLALLFLTCYVSRHFINVSA